MEPLFAACVGVSAMMFALGAVGSLFDALQSLTSSKSSSGAASANPCQGAANPFDLGSSNQAQSSTTGMSGQSSGWASISPQTMSALIDAQAQLSSTSSAPANPSDALKDLFSQIDADGNGSIDKSEFEDALGAGGTNLAAADDVFGKLDTDGNGSVSIDELKSALQGAGGHHGHHHMHAAPSSLTTDLATDLTTDPASSDGSTDPSTDSSDANSSTNRLRHLALTLVQHPPINLVPIDPTGHVNTAALDASLNQTLSISV
jgi:hypothetical protein